MFEQRGYANTTIEAIGQKAGVAPETVYAVFGSKPVLLRTVVETTLVGDYESTPFFERPFIQETLRQTNPQLLVQHFAGDMYQIMTRMSPVFSLLRSTAKTDSEIMALLHKILKNRQEGMAVFVNGLQKVTPLRESISQKQAVDTVFALSSAEVFDLLTQDMGWSKEQYIDWLSGTLRRLLLP